MKMKLIREVRSFSCRTLHSALGLTVIDGCVSELLQVCDTAKLHHFE